MFATSGADLINLDSDFRNKVGKQFTSDQYKQSHAELDRILGPEQVDDIMHRITSAKSQWNINAVDYGPALAVVKTSKESHLQSPLLSEQGLQKLGVGSEVPLLPANRSITTPTQTSTAVAAAAAAAPLAALYVYQSVANLPPDHWLYKAVFNNPVRKALADVSNFAKKTYQHGFSPTQANEQSNQSSIDADSGQNRGIENTSEENPENANFPITKAARKTSEPSHSHMQSRNNAGPEKLRTSRTLASKSPSLIGKTPDNTSALAALRHSNSQKIEPNKRSSTPLAR